ncbi:MAG: hypothetical protein OEM26_15545 [Saprospiraceae bacterium]|nr:hypothetical protein [Saprospiraceae bacterium]
MSRSKKIPSGNGSPFWQFCVKITQNHLPKFQARMTIFHSEELNQLTAMINRTLPPPKTHITPTLQRPTNEQLNMGLEW